MPTETAPYSNDVLAGSAVTLSPAATGSRTRSGALAGMLTAAPSSGGRTSRAGRFVPDGRSPPAPLVGHGIELLLEPVDRGRRRDSRDNREPEGKEPVERNSGQRLGNLHAHGGQGEGHRGVHPSGPADRKGQGGDHIAGGVGDKYCGGVDDHRESRQGGQQGEHIADPVDQK